MTKFEDAEVAKFVASNKKEPLSTAYNMGYKNALKDVIKSAKGKDIETLLQEIKQTRNSIVL